MTKNRIDDLRNHLFETLEALKDEDAPMELDRARAIADVARVIVDTAKVEVAFVNATGERSTGFPRGGRRASASAPAGRAEDGVSARTGARPPRWAQGPVVEGPPLARDERIVRALGTALGIAATLGLVALAWSLL